MLHRRVSLASRNMETFSEQFKVMNHVFHIGLHAFTVRWCYFIVTSNDRARVGAQPANALFYNVIRLPKFFHAHQITVVTIAIDSNWNIKLQLAVNLVGLFSTQIPFHTATAQHRAGETQRQRAFRAYNTNTNSALLPDAIVR